jgi:hypothetical protein
MKLPPMSEEEIQTEIDATDATAIPTYADLASGLTAPSREEALQIVEEIDKTTAGHVPKRQAEQIAAELTRDFDDFYVQREQPANDALSEQALLVGSSDSKGVRMLPQALREATRRHGTLLVIDETHTICAGPGGYTRAHGLEPDFLTIGKTIGGGVPAAAYGFTEEVRDRSLAAMPPQTDVGGIGGTLAGNALLERKGARTGVVTTRGFRDVLETGREQRYDLYDVHLDLPAPLVPLPPWCRPSTGHRAGTGCARGWLGRAWRACTTGPSHRRRRARPGASVPA